MRRFVVGALLLVAILAQTTGCSGAVSLKRSKTFTPSAVKAIQYHDVCRLQGYFDRRPAQPDELDSSMLTRGNGSAGQGRVTLRLKAGPQKRTFARLLRTFFRSDKRLDASLAPGRELRVTVPYYVPSSGSVLRQLPIGAEVQVLGPEGPVPLAYHPCLGEFFFGERIYHVRRQVFGPARIGNGSQHGRYHRFRSAIPSLVP